MSEAEIETLTEETNRLADRVSAVLAEASDDDLIGAVLGTQVAYWISLHDTPEERAAQRQRWLELMDRLTETYVESPPS